MSDDRDKVLGMKKTITPEDLATKTCKRGHTGQYVLRKGANPACRACSKISYENYRGAPEARATKQREKATERLSELSGVIEKLRVELALAEAEKNFLTKTLEILNTTK